MRNSNRERRPPTGRVPSQFETSAGRDPDEYDRELNLRRTRYGTYNAPPAYGTNRWYQWQRELQDWRDRGGSKKDEPPYPPYGRPKTPDSSTTPVDTDEGQYLTRRYQSRMSRLRGYSRHSSPGEGAEEYSRHRGGGKRRSSPSPERPSSLPPPEDMDQYYMSPGRAPMADPIDYDEALAKFKNVGRSRRGSQPTKEEPTTTPPKGATSQELPKETEVQDQEETLVPQEPNKKGEAESKTPGGYDLNTPSGVPSIVSHVFFPDAAGTCLADVSFQIAEIPSPNDNLMAVTNFPFYDGYNYHTYLIDLVDGTMWGRKKGEKKVMMLESRAVIMPTSSSGHRPSSVGRPSDIGTPLAASTGLPGLSEMDQVREHEEAEKDRRTQELIRDLSKERSDPLKGFLQTGAELTKPSKPSNPKPKNPSHPGIYPDLNEFEVDPPGMHYQGVYNQMERDARDRARKSLERELDSALDVTKTRESSFEIDSLASLPTTISYDSDYFDYYTREELDEKAEKWAFDLTILEVRLKDLEELLAKYKRKCTTPAQHDQLMNWYKNKVRMILTRKSMTEKMVAEYELDRINHETVKEWEAEHRAYLAKVEREEQEDRDKLVQMQRRLSLMSQDREQRQSQIVSSSSQGPHREVGQVYVQATTSVTTPNPPQNPVTSPQMTNAEAIKQIRINKEKERARQEALQKGQEQSRPSPKGEKTQPTKGTPSSVHKPTSRPTAEQQKQERQAAIQATSSFLNTPKEQPPHKAQKKMQDESYDPYMWDEAYSRQSQRPTPGFPIYQDPRPSTNRQGDTQGRPVSRAPVTKTTNTAEAPRVSFREQNMGVHVSEGGGSRPTETVKPIPNEPPTIDPLEAGLSPSSQASNPTFGEALMQAVDNHRRREGAPENEPIEIISIPRGIGVDGTPQTDLVIQGGGLGMRDWEQVIQEVRDGNVRPQPQPPTINPWARRPFDDVTALRNHMIRAYTLGDIAQQRREPQQGYDPQRSIQRDRGFQPGGADRSVPHIDWGSTIRSGPNREGARPRVPRATAARMPQIEEIEEPTRRPTRTPIPPTPYRDDGVRHIYYDPGRELRRDTTNWVPPNSPVHGGLANRPPQEDDSPPRRRSDTNAIPWQCPQCGSPSCNGVHTIVATPENDLSRPRPPTTQHYVAGAGGDDDGDDGDDESSFSPPHRHRSDGRRNRFSGQWGYPDRDRSSMRQVHPISAPRDGPHDSQHQSRTTQGRQTGYSSYREHTQQQSHYIAPPQGSSRTHYVGAGGGGGGGDGSDDDGDGRPPRRYSGYPPHRPSSRGPRNPPSLSPSDIPRRTDNLVFTGGDHQRRVNTQSTPRNQAQASDDSTLNRTMQDLGATMAQFLQSQTETNRALIQQAQGHSRYSDDHLAILRDMAHSNRQRSYDHVFAAIPAFDGSDPKMCLSWIRRLRDACLESGRDVLFEAKSKSLGVVRSVLNSIRVDARYSDIEGEMLRCFSDMRTPAEAAVKLQGMHQGPKQILREHVDEYDTCTSIAIGKDPSDINDLTRVLHFLTTINNQNLAHKIRKSDKIPVNLRKCFDKVLALENRFMFAESADAMAEARVMEVAHSVRPDGDFTVEEVAQLKKISKLNCWNCGGKGHFRNECPLSTDGGQQTRSVKSDQGKGTMTLDFHTKVDTTPEMTRYMVKRVEDLLNTNKRMRAKNQALQQSAQNTSGTTTVTSAPPQPRQVSYHPTTPASPGPASPTSVATPARGNVMTRGQVTKLAGGQGKAQTPVSRVSKQDPTGKPPVKRSLDKKPTKTYTTSEIVALMEAIDEAIEESDSDTEVCAIEPEAPTDTDTVEPDYDTLDE